MYNIKTSIIMKKLMNLSKLAITALITSSLFVACSEEISENTVDTPYTAKTGNIRNVGQAVDLGLPSGTKWANMNIGATSETDNGILFIWGDITGTKMLADNPTSYTNVTEMTSVSDLFEMYLGEKKNDGQLCDTTQIGGSSQAKLIGTSDMTAREKKEAILAYLKAKLDEGKKAYSGKGLLEATLENAGINDKGDEETFYVIMNWDGSDYKERIVSLEKKYDIHPEWGQVVTPEDSLKYYDIYQYEGLSDVKLEEIFTTTVKYQTSGLANNWADVKDVLGTVIRKDYTGGTFGNAVKDRLDAKKKNNLTFVPVYSIISDAKKDPATANWGNDWRMPSTMDFVELLENCEWEFTGSGYKVTGPNGNSIFLPAAGYRFGDKLYDKGNSGYYASGEITGTFTYPSMAAQANGSEGAISSNENMPNMLIFQHGQYNSLDLYDNLSSSYGVSIRPVTK